MRLIRPNVNVVDEDHDKHPLSGAHPVGLGEAVGRKNRCGGARLNCFFSAAKLRGIIPKKSGEEKIVYASKKNLSSVSKKPKIL